nr:MAG TPA: hypothetical protein [Caudoviricetes sp.]
MYYPITLQSFFILFIFIISINSKDLLVKIIYWLEHELFILCIIYHYIFTCFAKQKSIKRG